MLTPEQMRILDWHPLRVLGRVENYALGLPRRTVKGLVYGMACGHDSLPRVAACKQGCKEAPAYPAPYVLHENWAPVLKFNERHNLTTFEAARKFAQARKLNPLMASEVTTFPRR